MGLKNWKQGIRERADLKIDYDTHRHNPIQRFNFRAKYLLRYYPHLSPMKVKVYKTKKGYHFYVYYLNKKPIATFDGVDVVLTQLILGSDWLRELRNIYRISKGDAEWNLLFSEKDKRSKLQYERFYCAYILR
jgi:hypothetical protein